MTLPAPTPLTYDQAGVSYELIDPLKVAAQQAAAATAGHLAAHGFSEVTASRGESAYVVDVGPFYLASIVECLGSKALVADEMQGLTGRSYYGAIAQDTIAMAVNDLITVGATPLVVQAYWAAGGSDWFGDAQRAKALVDGWKRACEHCGVSWGDGRVLSDVLSCVLRWSIGSSNWSPVSEFAQLSRSRSPRNIWTTIFPAFRCCLVC
jgi:phosphoribosylformylglycinamidine cyclo-ligase